MTFILTPVTEKTKTAIRNYSAAVDAIYQTPSDSAIDFEGLKESVVELLDCLPDDKASVLEQEYNLILEDEDAEPVSFENEEHNIIASLVRAFWEVDLASNFILLIHALEECSTARHKALRHCVTWDDNTQTWV